MAGVATPEWLAKRGGSLREATDGRSWIVLLDQEPRYRLEPIPAAGKYSCAVTETVNGRRLEGGGTYASVEDAVLGGLEDLRKFVGW